MTRRKGFERPGVESDTVAELSQKLLEANSKLQKAEKERKAMIENISHDLRAPLTAVRSTVDCLLDMDERGEFSKGADEVGNMLRLLDSRTRNLEVLINDLYYLTKLESGTDEVKLKEIPLAQFLEEYFFSAEVDDRYKDRNLLLEVPDDMACIVLTDTNKLTRVLDNFFTNAQKYSDDGDEIALGAKLEGDSAVFYVRDSGQGIPKDDLPYVFDRTFRVSGARTPSGHMSSGLGLAIVKSIVEKQLDGEAWCESSLGEGSTFFVRLKVKT